MDVRLLEFVEILRRNGIRVATDASIQAARALEALGFDEPGVVRAALRTTTCPRPTDRSLWEELFDLYWMGAARAADDGAPLETRLLEAGLTPDQVAALLAMLQALEGSLADTTRAALAGRGAAMARLLLAGALHPDARADMDRIRNVLQLGFYTERLLDRMGWSRVDDDLKRLREVIHGRLPMAQAAAAEKALQEALAEARRAARRHVEREYKKRNLRAQEDQRMRALAERSFYSLSADDIASMREVVRRLGRKLRGAVERRMRVRKRGRIDLRRTMRRALATGGVPVRLAHRLRRREKPEVVILCDISDSVRNVSRFMLQFVHTLQDLFARVRSYVFVADLGECTALFKAHEVDVAIDMALSGRVVSTYANSNFGRAFAQFAGEHLEAVTSRTTVLVIGDGRNNYNPAEGWALEAVRRRARRLVWLNPEDRLSWGFGDSEMRTYAPICSQVHVVQSLAGLERVVESLIL
jgi:uncharacterized protein with von Willebrand factor type A (vWA) domain